MTNQELAINTLIFVITAGVGIGILSLYSVMFDYLFGDKEKSNINYQYSEALFKPGDTIRFSGEDKDYEVVEVGEYDLVVRRVKWCFLSRLSGLIIDTFPYFMPGFVPVCDCHFSKLQTIYKNLASASVSASEAIENLGIAARSFSVRAKDN